MLQHVGTLQHVIALCSKSQQVAESIIMRPAAASADTTASAAGAPAAADAATVAAGACAATAAAAAVCARPVGRCYNCFYSQSDTNNSFFRDFAFFSEPSIRKPKTFFKP
jgi:hypothetical protein